MSEEAKKKIKEKIKGWKSIFVLKSIIINIYLSRYEIFFTTSLKVIEMKYIRERLQTLSEEI